MHIMRCKNARHEMNKNFFLACLSLVEIAETSCSLARNNITMIVVVIIVDQDNKQNCGLIRQGKSAEIDICSRTEMLSSMSVLSFLLYLKFQ